MVSKAALLQAVNRNLYQIADHNGYGLFAYGSRGCIYVLDLRAPLAIVVDSKVLRNGHRGRVLSLSFCKSDRQELLASIGEEMILKIWDLNIAECIASLEVKEGSQVVEWLYDSPNLVAFSDKHGTVCKWNFKTNNQVKIKSGSDRSITVMSSNKKSPELFAVGHSVGTICILNMNNHTCIKILKAHSMEIHSLCWSPVSPTTLLSSSLDQSARIWKIDEDKPVHTYYYPSARYKDKMEDKKNSRICSTFHPGKPDTIICSNVRGAVGSVCFNENAPPKFTPFATEEVDPYFKAVFQILPYVDVTGENKHVILTFDPVKLVQWNVSDGKVLSAFYFTQGHIFCISVSPINEYLLAVGAGDGFLRVLNTQSEEKYIINTIYINLRMKIMSIAWHPTEENIIAYGSDEGRVGIVDFSKRRNMFSFETHHTNSVYCLQWGPCCKISDSKQTYFLYSCGGGTVFIHELHKPKANAVTFDSIVNVSSDLELDHKSYSELRWKSDFTCLALGTFHGSVYLFSEKFDLLCQFSLQLKYLENLRWHPLHTYASCSKESKFSSWLAAVGNDENIHIFDAADVLKGESDGTFCKPVKTLIGHKKRVSAVCWSPHTDGHLVSSSRDGTIQVWDVVKGTAIINYMWHKDRVYAVHWSIFNPDVIYSGGMDCFLRIWRISEQNLSEIPEKLISGKYKPFKKHITSGEKRASKASSSEKNENLESEADSVEITLDSEAQTTSGSSKAKMKPFKSRADFQKEKEAKASFFTLKAYSKEESFQNIFKLVDSLCDEAISSNESSKETTEELLDLGLFGDQVSVLKMLEARGKIENTSGNKEKAACLQIIACNVIELLTEAAEKKELTDFLVSVAPTVSYKFWLDICEKYAVQLIEEQQFMKGSIYFMLCGKLYDALRILVERGKLIDALALAKARLPENDPTIKTIFYKVSSMFSMRKQIENEAACHIALKDPLHAAKIMYCAGDAKYAYASVYICKKFNLPEIAEEYAVMCMEKCLAQNDWPTFYKLAEIIESVQIYKIIVRVHEIFFSYIRALKKEEGIAGNSMFGVTGSKILIWNGKTLGDSNLSFLFHVYNVLKCENLLPNDKESLESTLQALNSMEARKNSDVPSEAHVNVAIYVSQMILNLLLDDPHDATKNFTRIFSSTYNIVFMPKIICWTFLPLNIYWCSNKNTFICELQEISTEVMPFPSHFQSIYNSVCDKFGCIDNTDIKVSPFSSDLISNLDVTMQTILSALSSKTVEDSILLYFSSYYLCELRRLAKKGWRFRCYDNSTVSDVTTEEISYSYDMETGKWFSIDAAIGKKFVSVEDVLLRAEETGFQLTQDHLTETNDQRIIKESSFIKEFILQVFSSEIDSAAKDKLVQSYGFKDTSDFLLKIMSDSKVPESPENKSEVGSTTDSVNDQTKESGEVCLQSLEDEYFHAQCWTDISLFYVLTKSLFSAICKVEFAFLYCLQNYLYSLDKEIAVLARLHTTSDFDLKPNSANNLPPDHKMKTNNLDTEQKIVNGFETNSGESPSKEPKLSLSGSTEVLVMDENKPKTAENITKLLSEIVSEVESLISKNNSAKNIDNFSTEANFKQDNSLNSRNKDSYITISNSSTIPKCESESNSTDIIELNADSTSNTATKSDSTSNVFNGNVSLNSTNQPGNADRSLNDDVTDNAVTVRNNLENEVCQLSEKDQNLTENPGIEICDSSKFVVTKDYNSNAFNGEERKTKLQNNKVMQEKLLSLREKISEQIKLLQLEAFWYPDPFVSAAAMKGLCHDIFHKHPCILVKQKFHELSHEVDQWCSNCSITKVVYTCDICQKLSA